MCAQYQDLTEAPEDPTDFDDVATAYHDILKLMLDLPVTSLFYLDEYNWRPLDSFGSSCSKGYGYIS